MKTLSHVILCASLVALAQADHPQLVRAYAPQPQLVPIYHTSPRTPQYIEIIPKGIGQRYQPQPQPIFVTSPAPIVAKPAPVIVPALPAPKPQEPKGNCSVTDLTKEAELCIPTLEEECENVLIQYKKVEPVETCYTVTKSSCSEEIEEVEKEICSYSFEQRSLDISLNSVKVAFEHKTALNRVTECEEAPKQSYGGYGKGGDQEQNCKEFEVKTKYSIPHVKQRDTPVTLFGPDVVKTCITKRLFIPNIVCSEEQYEVCNMMPTIEDVEEEVEICRSKVSEPQCSDVRLKLPEQQCTEEVPKKKPKSKYDRYTQ